MTRIVTLRAGLHIPHTHKQTIPLCILCDTAEAGFCHMVAVQEGLLGVGLDPDLALGILGQQVQRGHRHAELTAPGKLADAGTARDKVVAGDVGALQHDVLTHIVHPVAVQAEAVLAIGSLNQQLEVGADAVAQRKGEKVLVIQQTRMQ